MGFALWLFGALVGSPVSAEILAVYSFSNAVPAQTDDFTNDFAASDVSASMLSTHALDVLGVVSGFLGATDNNSYSNFFDGKGFAARSGVLVDEGTAPSPVNNYVEFTLSPLGNRRMTITEVSVDFGLDDATSNVLDTQARYDLYLSTNGSTFTRIGLTSTHSNVGKAYPGYTIRNDVSKTVTGFAALTNSITFRLAFADSNASNALKRVFFDDIEVQGAVVPTVTLEVDDAIAWEQNSNHWAQFSLSRSDAYGQLWVNFALTDPNLTNSAAARDVDYTANATNWILFDNGISTRKVRIRPLEDRVIEPPESITLTLLENTNYLITGPSNGVAVLFDDELPGLPVCFRDNFNANSSATNWTIIKAQRSGTPENPLIDFAYDYSVDGIPPAPGGTDTLGLKIAFTNANAVSPAVVNLFHSGMPCITDKYALDFDAYLQFDEANNSPEHLLAGINASPNQTNLIFRSGGFVIRGDAQFVTLVNNDSTNSTVGRAQLWYPTQTNDFLDEFQFGSTADQLLNNPPYGANGGDAGVIGCDVASTTKNWVHCQLMQLGDVVSFRINGYKVLESTINTNQQPGLFRKMKAPGALSYGAIMLGYLNQYNVNSTNAFVVFDNVNVTDLSSIGIISLAIASPDVALNFYSQLSDSNNPAEFKILKSVNGANQFKPFTNPAPELKRITVPGSDGYYGAYFYDEYAPGTNAAEFYEVRWSTNKP